MLRYDIAITIAGPFITTGVVAAAHGIDAPFLRDHNRDVIIPGTQIRGILRHVLTAMAEAAPSHLTPTEVSEWFGSASGDAETGFGTGAHGWAPVKGRVRFSDLVASDRRGRIDTMTRIAVDDWTGSVLPGALQVLEQPIKRGETAVFSGTIAVDLEPAAAARFEEWAVKALKLVPAIGAHKSSGFGRLIGAPLIALSKSQDIAGRAAAPSDHAAIVAAGAARVTLRFDGPFLVSAGRWTGNDYSGSEVVPGAVVKAVVARAIGADQAGHALHSTLAKAVFRELRPVGAGGKRPVAVPLSLYWWEDETGGETYDALDDGCSALEMGAFGHVTFRPDVKPGSNFQKELDRRSSWTFEGARHVRTRTKVDSRGLADTGKLFTYSAVEPGDHLWIGTIARGDLDDDAFASLIAALPDRLDGIGKTRVSARLELGAETEPVWRPAASGRVRLLLETDACLHTPEDWLSRDNLADAGERLRLQYQDYFGAALAARAPAAVPVDAAALDLRFFAQQRRAGGYIAARYPPAAHGYRPWVLTTAGSVFDFVVPPSHSGAITSFLRRGLPVPAGFDALRRSWQGNPFVPENGFGEVASVLPVGA